MSTYIEITEAQTDSGSPIDEDLMRGTTGADPDGGIRGNLRNLDARMTVVEGGGGGGGGAAGVEVEERFTELRKQFGNAVVDGSSECVCESFYAKRPYFNYRLMRDVASTDTALYIAPNPKTIEGGSDSTNLNFLYTGFTWSALAGTDASSVAADATNKLVGGESVSWSKAGGTAVTSAIERDVGASLAWSIATYKKIICAVRIDTTTNLTDFFVRVSDKSTTGTDFREWRVTADHLGNSFIASGTGIGWNFLEFTLSDAASATGGADFDPDTQLARSWAFGSIVSSSGQTHAVNLDAFWHAPHSFNGISVVHPEVDQLSQVGDTLMFIDSSNKEFKVLDVGGAAANPSVILRQDVSAGFTNAFTAGTSTSIRRSTLLTDNNRAEFDEDDSELTSGTSENDQSVILKTVLPESAASKNFDFSVDFDTTLKFFVKEKPTATTLKADSDADLSGEMLSGDTFRLYNIYWSEGRAHYAEVADTAGQVTLTANSSFSSSEITWTVSSGDNSKISVGMLLVKEDEVQTAVSIAALTANDGNLETYSTPDSRPIEDTGFPYPQVNSLAFDYRLGAVNQTAALRNLRGTEPALTVAGTITTNNLFEPSVSAQQLAAGPFSSSNYFEFSTTQFMDAALFSYATWVKFTALGSFEPIFSNHNGVSTGFSMHKAAGTDTLQFYRQGTTTTSSHTFLVDTWYHLGFIFNDNVPSMKIYVNGVEETLAGVAVAANSNFRIGKDRGSSSSPNMQVARATGWAGINLAASDFLQLYNAGIFRELGAVPGAMKYRYNLTAQTGQKVVTHTRLSREVNTHNPLIRKIIGVKIS